MFSLGIVLYELVVGRHPFEASSDMAVLSCDHPPRSTAAIAPQRPGAKRVRLAARANAGKESGSTSNGDRGCDYTRRHRRTDSGLQSDTSQSSSRSDLVGREIEKAALSEEFIAASSGRASMVCVSGEPGIGKTTLVEDFLADLTRNSQHLVARGRCSERLAGAEAYLPILDAIEDLLGEDHGGKIRDAFNSHAPSWTKQVAPFATGPGPVAPPASQERLKRELAAFLGTICAMQPLVLFIEDIHWADTSTVDLLAYIITRSEQRASVHDCHLQAVRAPARPAPIPRTQARPADTRNRARASARLSNT